MLSFVGRDQELRLLGKRFQQVRQGKAQALTIRGRRQVGKSRLVQEFCDRAKVGYLYFTATKGASQTEALADLTSELAGSTLAVDPDLLPQRPPTTWMDLWRLLATVLPDQPSIVVLDELPWLAETTPTFDGTLQTAWDRLLSKRPLLLLLLGSDLHMMSRLTAYDHPFYGRADHHILGALNPAETQDALALSAAQALDAHLITGGLPGIIASWMPGEQPQEFLRAQCHDPASPVFSVPEATLLSEFPQPMIAARIIEAIGGQERTHANIAAAIGGEKSVPSGALSPMLAKLTNDKHILALDQPLSTKASKPGLYRVADSNLRLYLGILRQAHLLVRRGRNDQAGELIEARWSAWRGRAVEVVVRESLELAGLAGELPWPEVAAVGGWWNRQFNPEIDLVGADAAPVARRIDFVGSVKWLASPVDRHDIAALHRGAVSVPGFDERTTGTVISSLSGRVAGVDHSAVDLWWGPDEVVGAFR